MKWCRREPTSFVPRLIVSIVVGWGLFVAADPDDNGARSAPSRLYQHDTATAAVEAER